MITFTELIHIFMAFLGSLGFAILYNIRGKKLVFAALGGLIGWVIFVILNDFIINEAVICFVASVVVSLYAEIMARVLKTPTTTFIATSLIPLVPGSALYYTMASAFEGNLDKFTEKAIYTLQLACALALGVVVVAAFTRLVYRFTSKK